jgi:hypothetical protein
MDGVLDLDLQAVQVSGSVTLNGAALPPELGSRGYISFFDAEQNTGASFDLGASGAGAYTLTLPPGKYEVRFSGSLEMCSPATTAMMPCGSATLVPEIDLQADGVLDLDIPAVTLSGAVTLDGSALPAETLERGALQFIGSEEGSFGVVTRSLGATGAASYSVVLPPGQYDIAFGGNTALCQTGAASLVPCNSGVVLPGVNATVTGVMDVDLSAVTVSGSVTLAGAPLPTEALSRGAISFNSGESTVTSADLGTTGPGAYSLTLLPGTYDVGFAGNLALCSSETAAQVPCNSGILVPATALNADGVLDLDVPAVTISGSVTLNDAEFPAQARERGAIHFGNDGSYAISSPFGTSGPVSYQMTMLPGSYEVFYAASLECDATSLAPCNSGKLLEAQSFMADGVLDLDVPAVQISGSVTVNGAPVADGGLPRGQLSFLPQGGGEDTGAALTESFAATGAVTYTISLLPGSYRVELYANNNLCGTGSVPPMPCVGGPLLGATAFTADGVLDIDVPSRFISGSITLEGATLPTEPLSRGSILFTLLGSGVDAGNNPVWSGSTGDLGTTGAAQYGIAIMPGRYVIQHGANSQLCGPGLSAQLPCASQIILGCD